MTVMTVSGTAGADTISLNVSGGVVTATVNGTPSSQSDILVTSVVIDGSDGADTISIHSTGSNPVTVNCGNGNDSVDIAPTSQNLDNIGDNITVNGDANTDTVTLHDSSRTTARTFTFSNGKPGELGRRPVVTVNTSEKAGRRRWDGQGFLRLHRRSLAQCLAGRQHRRRSGQRQRSAAANILYSPDAASSDSGVVDHGSFNTTFTNCGSVYIHDVATANMISPTRPTRSPSPTRHIGAAHRFQRRRGDTLSPMEQHRLEGGARPGIARWHGRQQFSCR